MFIFEPHETDGLGILRPMNPLMGYREGWSEAQAAWYMGGASSEGWSENQQAWYMNGIDDTLSPMIRSDVATPTVDMTNSAPFQMPALNGGLGAVQDALSVLSVVDLLTRG